MNKQLKASHESKRDSQSDKYKVADSTTVSLIKERMRELEEKLGGRRKFVLLMARNIPSPQVASQLVYQFSIGKISAQMALRLATILKERGFKDHRYHDPYYFRPDFSNISSIGSNSDDTL